MKKIEKVRPRKSKRGRPRSLQASHKQQLIRMQLDRLKALYGLKTDAAAIRKGIALDVCLKLKDDSEGDWERRISKMLHPGNQDAARARAKVSAAKKAKASKKRS